MKTIFPKSQQNHKHQISKMLGRIVTNTVSSRSMILGLIISGITATASAQSSETNDKANFKPIIKQAIEHAIIPGYKSLTEAATRQEDYLKKLCEEPNEKNLKEAQKAFRPLVATWSGVEMYRIGPALKDNRQEKLFFWPDRKSIGLRQVRKLIDTQDKTALTTETLQKKSVAVQGILALEYVLFGKNSEILATAAPKSYRCNYGLTITRAIQATGQDIIGDWKAPSGYASQMLDADATKPIYRSDAEVMQDLLRISSEMIQSTRDLKIQNTIKDTPQKSKPKRAPFWRSNLTLHAYQNNLHGVKTLFIKGGLAELTPRYAKSLSFELEQTNKFLRKLEQENIPWEKLVKQKESHETLAFTLIPLEGAHYIVSDLIPQKLGLSLGFNSLDGD